MKLILKRTLIVVVAIAALLTAQVGGVLSMRATPAHLSAARHTQPTAWYCPAPPVTCLKIR